MNITSQAEKSSQELLAYNVHVKEFLLSSCLDRFRGSVATRRWREITLSDPVWCHGSIFSYCIVWRWETQCEMMFEEQQHCSNVPTYRQDAIFLRCIVVPTLFHHRKLPTFYYTIYYLVQLLLHARHEFF